MKGPTSRQIMVAALAYEKAHPSTTPGEIADAKERLTMAAFSAALKERSK